MRALVDTSALLALANGRDQWHARAVQAAREAVGRLLADPVHEWLAVTPDVVHHANTGWLMKYPDQGFSLTDAINFETMRRARVTHAFAFDRHFEVAGFKLIN